MRQKSGSWSRTLAAIGLAVGISFSGAVATVSYADDGDDSRDFKAFLYEGTVADLEDSNTVKDVDEIVNDHSRDDSHTSDGDSHQNSGAWDDDDWDDDHWDDDDWDDDDWDDDDWNDDDWDDDDWDDDDWDDDDWDDFGGAGLDLNGINDNFRLHAQHDQENVDDDLWNMIGNGEERPANLFSTQGKIDDDHGLTVQSLVDGDYMIVVHEDDDTDSAILAAGDIEGVTINGAILIDLQEIDGSGYEGRTLIETSSDDDNDDLIFTVGLFQAGAVEPLYANTSRDEIA